MSINSKLTIFAARELVLARDAGERFRIEISIKRLKTKLKQKFLRNIKDFILFGSYTRNTILPRKYDPNSDVDLMVIFNSNNGVKTPETYRRNLIYILDEAYPNSIYEKDFPAVKLELNHIKFDIVPSYKEESFFGGKSFYIPDSGNRWQITEPNDINEDLSSRNQSYGNNLVRNTLRLCKHWNAFAGYPFESYIMEKEILGSSFSSSNNLYDSFLEILGYIADDLPGVSQALSYISRYQGGIFEAPNEQKQLEWLQKLLPGLE